MSMQQLLVLGKAIDAGTIHEDKEGKTYAKFTLVVKEYLGGVKEEKVSYFRVVDFGKSASKVEAIQKGDYVMVEGRPEADGYLTGEGEVKAEMVVFAYKWRVLK